MFYGCSSLTTLDLSNFDTRASYNYRRPNYGTNGIIRFLSNTPSLWQLKLGANTILTVIRMIFQRQGTTQDKLLSLWLTTHHKNWNQNL
ncbi:hypothetical protein [Xylocopilactobacillus apicola]|uniref:hypothetical protein n=1 Tax=Xylocopilactobacillus apicola TaxID=2932184 RepID=UPI003CE48066